MPLWKLSLCFWEDRCTLTLVFYATLISFATSFRENNKEQERLRLVENYPHRWSFCTFESVQERIPQMFSILPSGWDQRDAHRLLAPAVPPTTRPCRPASACSWQPPGSRRGLPASCQLNPTESPSRANKWLGSATRVACRASRWASRSVALQGAVTVGKVSWKGKGLCQWLEHLSR